MAWLREELVRTTGEAGSVHPDGGLSSYGHYPRPSWLGDETDFASHDSLVFCGCPDRSATADGSGRPPPMVKEFGDANDLEPGQPISPMDLPWSRSASWLAAEASGDGPVADSGMGFDGRPCSFGWTDAWMT